MSKKINPTSIPEIIGDIIGNLLRPVVWMGLGYISAMPVEYYFGSMLNDIYISLGMAKSITTYHIAIILGLYHGIKD